MLQAVKCDNQDIADSFADAFAQHFMPEAHLMISSDKSVFSVASEVLYEQAHPLYMHEFVRLCAMHYHHYMRADTLIFADFLLNTRTKMLVQGAYHIELTDKETLLLSVLMQKSEPVQKEALIKAMWQQQAHVDVGSFDTHLYRLRQKIDDFFEITCSNNHYVITRKNAQ
jgi:Transcriptional regulatory protein, C terminal